MANLTVLQQRTLVQLVYQYLQGAAIADIQLTLTKLSNKTHCGGRYLYQQIKTTAIIRQRVFDALTIPPKEKAKYHQHDTLFSLLQRLHHDGYGHNHLEYLLKLINETHPQQFWLRIGMVSALTLSISSYFLYTQQNIMVWLYDVSKLLLPNMVLDWLKTSISLLKNIPILGIIYHSSLLLSQLYNTFYYGFANLNQKLTTSLFALLTKGAAISANLITILAAGVVTPTAGVLFVFSAMIEVAESIVHFISIMQQPLAEKRYPTHGQKTNQIRQENQKQLVSNTLIIKVSAAILTSIAIAIWCFYPLSFGLVLGVIAAMILISTIKYLIINRIEANHLTQLQHDLQHYAFFKTKAREPEQLDQALITAAAI